MCIIEIIEALLFLIWKRPCSRLTVNVDMSAASGSQPRSVAPLNQEPFSFSPQREERKGGAVLPVQPTAAPDRHQKLSQMCPVKGLIFAAIVSITIV